MLPDPGAAPTDPGTLGLGVSVIGRPPEQVPGPSTPARPGPAHAGPGEQPAAGDGWAALYNGYHHRTRCLARRICRNWDLAEEVVQDVFLAAWRDLDRFDPTRGTMAAWLMTLTHHKAVDAVRREDTRRRRLSALDQDRSDRTPPGATAADVAGLGAALTAQLRTALWALPAEQRETLAWAYYGNRTQREIAALTGVPLGTVKSRTFTAMQR